MEREKGKVYLSDMVEKLKNTNYADCTPEQQEQLRDLLREKQLRDAAHKAAQEMP